MVKLKPEIVDSIVTYLKENQFTAEEIAEKHLVSVSTVWRLMAKYGIKKKGRKIQRIINDLDAGLDPEVILSKHKITWGILLGIVESKERKE